MSREKVLIVEDQLAVRTMLVNFFSRRGYAVFQAENAFQAIKLFNTLNPQVIISDIKMPGMTGIDLLQEIRSQNSEVTFILITGYGTEEMILQALRKGASNFFRKPLQVQELFDWIETRKHEHDSEIPACFDAMVAEETSTSYLIKAKNLDIVPLVRQLCGTMNSRMSPKELRSIHLGFEEALTNAWEHGCLEITGDEKTQSIDDGTYESLLQSRLEKNGDRKIKINWMIDQNRLQVEIKDEGRGFPWSEYQNENPDLFLSHGRGLLLMKAFFDQIDFNETGNEVVLTKWISASNHAVTDEVGPHLHDGLQVAP